LANDKIIIRGARQHNLKGVDIDLPRNKLIVMTGLSGAGTSSLGTNRRVGKGWFARNGKAGQ